MAALEKGISNGYFPMPRFGNLFATVADVINAIVAFIKVPAAVVV